MRKNFYSTAAKVVFLLLLSAPFFAQKPSNDSPKPHPEAVKIALNYLAEQQTNWQLTDRDRADVLVQDHYTTADNGLTHVTLVQRVGNIELFNGIATITVLPSGQVLSGTARFLTNLAGKINVTEPNLAPETAIQKALIALNLKNTEGVFLKEKINPQEFIFSKNNPIHSDIKVKLKFFTLKNGKAKLSWDLNIDDGETVWSLRVDALDGQILDKTTWTNHCETPPQYRVENGTENHHDCAEHNDLVEKQPTKMFDELAAGEMYNVFPFPTESPLHGNRSILMSPAISTASPFGWHDTNGTVGAEYTITRGNNVHAYIDSTDTNVSANNEPNGGASLNFDFPYAPTLEPESSRSAAVTNLFYATNWMHDLSHTYGFNEAAGNFQQRNYSSVAGGNDALIAQAQDGAKAVTPKRNNANFTTFPDGSVSKLQMFVWSEYKERLLHITAPANLAESFETMYSNFGAIVTTTTVTGIAEILRDSAATTNLGCTSLLNTNLAGKIAIVDRGVCGFDAKALAAQKKGAIGLCVCYLDEQLTTVMGVNTAAIAAQVTIPLIAVRKSDCARIKAAAAAGNLRLSINRLNALSPELVDGAFDNGIIAHEYAHGISNRLTGGRLNVDCLSTSELKGGEGWSDFIALAMTAKATDLPNTPRTLGTFVARQQTTGKGIRSLPYTTDFAVNPHTYDDIIVNDDLHYVGEVWASTLWDMYWGLVGQYGFDANLNNLNSGNGRALKLVMDAMKIQPCNPGFLDARNAILKADTANYGGANSCLIWDVFARRGLGFNAAQGLATSLKDNTEGFDKMPFCVKKLKITKTATELIKAGDPISYTIQVINHKDAAVTGVIVTDSLAANTSFIANSNSRPVAQNGAALSFNIGTINPRDTIVITYRAMSDANKKSKARFFDDMEKTDSLWTKTSLTTDTVRWKLTDVDKKSGIKSFFIGYPVANVSDQSLETKNAILIPNTFIQPVLHFFHRYDTEAGVDGAIVQYSTNGTTWQDLGDRFFKLPYRGRMDFRTFGIPNQRAWYGKSAGWVSSVADLSFLKGQSAKFRFRFGINDNTAALGWYVDDVAVMDAVNYTTRARVTSGQGDLEIADLAARGTLVEPTLITSNREITEGGKINLFPNPVSNDLTINVLDLPSAQTTDVSIFATDGRLMWRSTQSLVGKNAATWSVDVSNFASGLYIVRLMADGKTAVAKFVK